jgi:hypothetical protein
MRTYRKLPKGNRSCPTQKLGFKDHKAAVFKMRSLRFGHPDRQYVPVRAYECHICGQWHMTSEER